jgi:hypothetical protein
MIYPAGMTRRRRRAAGGYDVRASLFSQGEVGGWWDPSDTSTLFQDSAGTTPVTTLGQPVGLVIDKSKGGLNALGPELVTNGDFSNGTTGWTGANGGAIANVSGELRVTNGLAATGRAAQALALVVGRSYLVRGTIRSGTAGNTAGIWVDSVNRFFTTSLTNVPFSFFLVATATSQELRVINQRADIGDITLVDNISVREVPGNHLVQTTDTARPRWDARSNLLTRTEGFNVSPWSSTNISVTSSADVAPDLTNTAALLTTTSNGQCWVAQSGGASAPVNNVVYSFSCYFKSSNTGRAAIGLRDSLGYPMQVFDLLTGTVEPPVGNAVTTVSNGMIQPLDNGWYRCSARFVSTNVGGSPFWWVAPDDRVSVLGDNVLVWGAQLEFGPTATQYQRVTTATDYADIGLPRYLSFDGFDDFLRTPTGADINFTSTDEMTVCAGVRKLSDAAFAPVAELSASLASNNGAFMFAAPISTIPNYAFSSKGTTQVNASYTDASIAAPNLSVVSGLAKIATPVVTLRQNGVQRAQGLASQGTGNFGTYPLFIGRRGGTSAPFNGRINQLVIRNRLTADADLANLERFVAAKTGVTL